MAKTRKLKCEEYQDLKKWLYKKELSTKLGGNLRMVDANVLLKHIKKHYIITKKVKDETEKINKTNP